MIAVASGCVVVDVAPDLLQVLTLAQITCSVLAHQATQNFYAGRPIQALAWVVTYAREPRQQKYGSAKKNGQAAITAFLKPGACNYGPSIPARSSPPMRRPCQF